MNCEKVRESILLYLYHELSPNACEQVEAHLDACESCSQACRRERDFLRSLDEREAPPEGLLTESRRDLMRSVHREQAERSSGAGWWGRFWEGLGSMRPAWRPTAALALLVLGFYAGRTIPPSLGGFSLTQPGAVESSVADLPVVADIESVRMNIEQDRVEIVVEQITRRTIAGAPQDPEIRALLLSTLREDPNSGVRLDTLDVLTTRAADGDVRRALREAMLEDSNPGVRLKAFEALKPHRGEPEIRDACLKVLLGDENPGMRVEAIDALTETPDRTLVEPLQQLVDRESNNYIRLRSRRVLHELNASADRF